MSQSNTFSLLFLGVVQVNNIESEAVVLYSEGYPLPYRVKENVTGDAPHYNVSDIYDSSVHLGFQEPQKDLNELKRCCELFKGEIVWNKFYIAIEVKI